MAFPIPEVRMEQPTGRCLWFSGRAGAGKRTIAARVVTALRADGLAVELLERDSVREGLGLGPAPDGDDLGADDRRLAWLASRFAAHGVIAVVVGRSARREPIEDARLTIRRFAEVFVDTPAELGQERSGELDLAFEAPVHPELRVVTHDRTADASAAQVISFLESGDLAAESSTSAGRAG
ncbi:MAG: adenylyl-sulfate kinase [Actinomycetia bacterium]|nr:adenylyl-sulfate kinase [Actinomycetes bacterium]